MEPIKINFDYFIRRLQNYIQHGVQPMSFLLHKDYPDNAYVMLISCLLSLRTKDVVTYPICLRLFVHAVTPQAMLAMPIATIESLIKPVNYYKRKALLLHTVSKDLLERFEGKVPCTLQELLSIKGVGLKTANLVLSQAFNIPALCVDTHVHRICNELGLVTTKTADQTYQALQSIVPKKYWIMFSYLLVMAGQNKISKAYLQSCLHP